MDMDFNILIMYTNCIFVQAPTTDNDLIHNHYQL